MAASSWYQLRDLRYMYSTVTTVGPRIIPTQARSQSGQILDFFGQKGLWASRPDKY